MGKYMDLDTEAFFRNVPWKPNITLQLTFSYRSPQRTALTFNMGYIFWCFEAKHINSKTIGQKCILLHRYVKLVAHVT